MELDHSRAKMLARNFLRAESPLARLGWGISGFVYLSPDLRTAIKVHRADEGSLRELEVYRRLRALSITKLHDLNVPKLRGSDFDARLIQMDFVSAAYLLDFAGVRFTPPDYP